MNDQDKIAELTAEIARLHLVLAKRQAKIGKLMGEAARAGIAGATVRGTGEVPRLIELLNAIKPNFGDVGSRDVEVRAQRERIEEAIAILSAAPASVPQLAAPQAYKLAPIHPTEAMNEAYNNVPSGIAGSPPHSSHVWAAMLAAVPDVAQPIPSDAHAVWVLRQISQLKPDQGATAIFMAREGLAAPAAPLPEQTGPSEIEAENERLREALADKVSASTLLTELNLKGGALNMQFEGGACQLFAESFGQQFREMGGDNYIEMGFACNDGLRLLVTMQRCDGKTPANLKAEAEAKLALVENELAELRSAASSSPAPAQQQEPSIFGIDYSGDYLAEVRDKALEEAAVVVLQGPFAGTRAGDAAAIRFLKSSKSVEPAAPGASIGDKQ